MDGMDNNRLIQAVSSERTPLFYYDLTLFRQTLEQVRKHGLSRGYKVHYAMKANSNDRILQEVLKAGLGIDCVSGGELQAALNAGFSPDEVAFAGVGKTDEEIRLGLRHGIYSFNCESIQEIEVIEELARSMDVRARIALRINPNVDAKTHKYITTGKEENKFGILERDLPALLERFDQYEHLELRGIHVHIGSQIRDLSSYRKLADKVNRLQRQFEQRGATLGHINVGGGLGINYEDPHGEPIPDFASYFSLFENHLELRDGQELHFELGRSLVGQCGSLITRVLFTKEGDHTHFAIVDAGMTELIRPALYQAEHHIDALTSEKSSKIYHVAGPICETADTFRSRIDLPELQRGDLLAIRSAGAYGQVMSSDYNLRPRAKAIYSDDL
ncbi:MAG: diaminopimelate decarboxylase [Balneolaceae bacterium]